MTGKIFSSTIGEEQALEIFSGAARAPRRPRPALTIKEAARETAVFAETDIMVVRGD